MMSIPQELRRENAGNSPGEIPLLGNAARMNRSAIAKILPLLGLQNSLKSILRFGKRFIHLALHRGDRAIAVASFSDIDDPHTILYSL